jgi:hypothetical protein
MAQPDALLTELLRLDAAGNIKPDTPAGTGVV